MSIFRCPVCKSALLRERVKYSCENGHSYDIAKQGYVNLLLSQKSKDRQHGDDKEMVVSRKAFLEKGYYQPLLDGICEMLSYNLPKTSSILDAGCGEGWYTQGIYSALDSSMDKLSVSGIDISKHAVGYCARRLKQLEFAVASIFDIPCMDGAFDAVINIFAPFAEDEFFRVLNGNGFVLKVCPLKKHLWELKELAYDQPYENERENLEYNGFEICDSREIKYDINLSCNSDIRNLFTMTPYYYRTPASGKERIFALETLDTKAEFGIYLYKKKHI